MRLLVVFVLIAVVWGDGEGQSHHSNGDQPSRSNGEGEGEGERGRELECHYPIYPSGNAPSIVFDREMCNLNNPRGITFLNDHQYLVAEAGVGGNFDSYQPLSIGPFSARSFLSGRRTATLSQPVEALEVVAPCATGPEGGAVCSGESSTLIQKNFGKAGKRVVRGLPSTGNVGSCTPQDPGYTPNGNQAVGLDDVAVVDGKVFGVVTWAPTSQAELNGDLVQFTGLETYEECCQPQNPRDGVRNALRRRRRGPAVRVVADVARWQFDDYFGSEGEGANSNPYSVLGLPNGELWVADAGANNVVRVNKYGLVSLVVDFEDAASPSCTCAFPGCAFPHQFVPNSLAYNPHDGDVYLGQLTGFPFAPGAASVYRIRRTRGDPSYQPTIVDDGEGEGKGEGSGERGREDEHFTHGSTLLDTFASEPYVSGFTNIIDIAFNEHGDLFVLEISHLGLAFPYCNAELNLPPVESSCESPGLPAFWDFCNFPPFLFGTLTVVYADGVRQTLIAPPDCEGGPVVQEPLVAPSGMAYRNGALYISNRGVFAGVGEVIRYVVPPRSFD